MSDVPDRTAKDSLILSDRDYESNLQREGWTKQDTELLPSLVGTFGHDWKKVASSYLPLVYRSPRVSTPVLRFGFMIRIGIQFTRVIE